jgi:hypothetical protein
MNNNIISLSYLLTNYKLSKLLNLDNYWGKLLIILYFNNLFLIINIIPKNFCNLINLKFLYISENNIKIIKIFN